MRESRGERNPAIFARLVNYSWFFFKWTLLLVIVCAVVAVWFFRDTLNLQIRDQVQAKLAEHFTGFKVRVQAAERLEGKGLLIRGLSLSERAARGPHSELVFLEEVFVACRTDWQDLISGQLDVSAVTVRRATVRATRRPDGSWSTDGLLPLHCEPDSEVEMRIEGGTLVIFDPLKNPSSTLTLRDINLEIHPRPLTSNVDTEPSSHFEGSLSGDHFGRVELQGWHDRDSRRWSVAGRVNDLAVSPDLQNSLPGQTGNWLRPAEVFRGTVPLTFRVDNDPLREQPYQFDISGTLQRGRIDDRRLPYPITDVSGNVRFTQDGFLLENIAARSGRTILSLKGHQNGYGPTSHLFLEGEGQSIELEQQLVQLMPPEWQQIWNKYQPAGQIDTHIKLEHDGTSWRPELTVNCTNLAFTHYRFPYRIERARGKITFKDDLLKVNLNAFAGSRPVQIESEITRPGPYGIGYVDVRTKNLPLDERFVAAIPEQHRGLVTSFAPHGTMDGHLRVKRNRPDATWEHHTTLDLNGIAIKHEKFPYALREIHGRLEGIGRNWTYRNLVGANDSGQVTAEGESVPVQDGSQLTLRVRGKGIPLDSDLRHCLSPEMQNVMKELRPRGVIDLDSKLIYNSGSATFDLTVQAQLGQDGILLEPEFFPYRLENVHGLLTFQQGQAVFRNLTANHGRTRLASQGVCRFQNDGSWECEFQNLTVDQLHLDRDLLFAMPPDARTTLSALKFSGPLNLAGGLRVAGNRQAGTPIRSTWDVQVNTLQGRADCGILLEQINGGARLVGEFDGRQFRTRGRLDFDSLLYRGLQFTKVRGPFYASNDRLLFGAGAQPTQPGRPPERITASIYDGSLAGDCELALGDPTRFALNAQIVDGDLERFATEAIYGPTALAGKVTADIKLRGTSHGVHTLLGSGKAKVRNGDVDQLPIVLSMVKFLSSSPSERSRFDTSEIEFRVNGSQILLDKINFYGDAISLLGKGEMYLDRRIGLVFRAAVGRDRLKLPVLSPILGEVGKQLMLVYVHGTIDNPQTTREALPGVRRAVQEIEEELIEPPGRKSALRGPLDWFESVLPTKPAPKTGA
ncbi:MAG: AsmA-like C-terminal region-containing protein [Pirellulales bacterium]